MSGVWMYGWMFEEPAAETVWNLWFGRSVEL